MSETLNYEQILKKSPDYPVVVKDNTHGLFEGSFFNTEEDAVASIANSFPNVTNAKLHVPMDRLMLGAYKLDDPTSLSRLNKDFRIVSSDRVLDPASDEDCAVLPYFVHYGLTSIEINTNENENDKQSPFIAAVTNRPFSLNILEPHVPWLDSIDVYPAVHVIFRPNGMSADEVVDRYTSLRNAAGLVLERVFNNPVARIS